MSQQTKQFEMIDQATYWRADRDQYLVNPAFRMTSPEGCIIRCQNRRRIAG